MQSLNSTQLIAMIEMAAMILGDQRTLLNALDSAIGDGDHGTALSAAFAEAVNKLHTVHQNTPSDVFMTTGTTLMNTMGGASGALFGTLFVRMSATVGAKTTLSASDVAEALQNGLTGVMQRGKAQVGDKTMVDALSPAATAFAAHPENLGTAFAAAADAAKEGVEATIPLIAKQGRARFAAERSIGHADAGATSISLIFGAFRDYCIGVHHGES